MASNKPSGPLAEFTRRPVFQLSIPALDLPALRAFYVDVFGSTVEREDASSIEFTFFGGLLVAYKVDEVPRLVAPVRTDIGAPLPHFGLVLSWEDWHRAVDHLDYVGVSYHTPPGVHVIADGRHLAVFAIADPSGNCFVCRAQRDDNPATRDAV